MKLWWSGNLCSAAPAGRGDVPISVELPILSREGPRSGSSLVKKHFLVPEPRLLRVF